MMRQKDLAAVRKLREQKLQEEEERQAKRAEVHRYYLEHPKNTPGCAGSAIQVALGAQFRLSGERNSSCNGSLLSVAMGAQFKLP